MRVMSKILLSDGAQVMIMDRSKQSKYTQQRSAWRSYSTAAINRPGFERSPAKLQSFERCQVARRRTAYARDRWVYQRLKAQWSQFRFTQLSGPLERHIVLGSRGPFVFVRFSIDDRRRRCRPRRCRRGVITVPVVVFACNNKDEWLCTAQ